jgi:hypothetical protein
MYIKLGPYSVNALFINDVHTLAVFRDGVALELDMLEKVGPFHDQPASVFALRSFPGVTAHTAKFGHMEINWPPADRISSFSFRCPYLHVTPDDAHGLKFSGYKLKPKSWGALRNFLVFVYPSLSSRHMRQGHRPSPCVALLLYLFFVGTSTRLSLCPRIESFRNVGVRTRIRFSFRCDLWSGSESL